MTRGGFLLFGLALAAGPALAAGLLRSGEDAARVAEITAPTRAFDAPEPYEDRPGGAGTVTAPDPRRAFLHPPANLPPGADVDFIAGHALFEKLWVAAPTATRASDGLGPLYNARACIACHVRNGRGHPPSGPRERPVSLVLHLARPTSAVAAMAEIEGWIATAPEPTYGRQIQTFATIGLPAEASVHLDWQEVPVTLGDGSVVALRRPAYSLESLAQGPLAPGTMVSPRVAPPMLGLGLLEAIPAREILAREDPEDGDGDGISGRANVVAGPDGPVLGRFGWKAGSATVRQQSAMAFARDIGISTPAFPAPWGDCTEAQPDCRAAPHGDGDARGFEADAATLDLTSAYAANIAVPARRGLDAPEVRAGKQLFYQTGCIACHTPKHVTARDGVPPEHAFQLIWPYSDLLLHDMGEGLGDGFIEGRATGREFRTPPLWGIGLTGAVTGETTYLHDGRARSLLEAVLWHGGEAQAARDAVAAMPGRARDALIRFLESL
jgi:CxxC motif-containing protein (DUF1111 family)